MGWAEEKVLQLRYHVVHHLRVCCMAAIILVDSLLAHEVTAPGRSSCGPSPCVPVPYGSPSHGALWSPRRTVRSQTLPLSMKTTSRLSTTFTMNDALSNSQTHECVHPIFWGPLRVTHTKCRQNIIVQKIFQWYSLNLDERV